MKELSIEEKAKAYDEAIKRLEDIKTGKCQKTFVFTEGLFDYIFHELKESEGERIRKALIRFHKSTIDVDGIKGADILAWLEKQGKNMGISEATKQKLEDNLNKALEKETPESWNKFLDEQGEQKETVCDKCKKAQPSHSCQDITALGRCALEKQGEQKPTVEMKTPEESLGIDSDTYNKIVDECVYGEQKSTWSEDDEMHIRELESLVKQVWAIAEHENHKETIHKMSDLSFFLKTLKPQPKQEWSEEDEQVIEDAETWLDSLCDYLKDSSSECIPTVKNIISKLKSLKDRVQPKQEWNEDTQQWIDAIIFDYESWYDADKDHRTTIRAKINILKSLKDRVQPKQEWSDYDECMLANLIDDPHCSIDSEYVHWLKSLKERYAWKPSDEQMNTLEYYLHNLICTKHKEILFGLYTDLKKLK